MANYIIESIGKWGIKTSPAQFRMDRPKPGDIIYFDKPLRKYPVSHPHNRISTIDANTGMVSIVSGFGSAFLYENGELSISGGPFFSMHRSTLRPMHTLIAGQFWNWGDNLPGANQGVYYTIDRPMFRATIHPNAFQTRYGKTEDQARKGRFPHEVTLGGDWLLIAKHEASTDNAYVFARDVK